LAEKESINMEYIPHILTFLLVLSPLFIPIGVSGVHAIRTWPALVCAGACHRPVTSAPRPRRRTRL